MSDNSNGALYEPLVGDKAVRFIKLLPGKADEQICVEFLYQSVLFKLGTFYEATSYTWGSPTPTQTILCNGKAFQLRQNAHDFLKRLRQPDVRRMLWMHCVWKIFPFNSTIGI
ncbi:Putative heterokaryon incompatibility [Septoria linicola]|uniref:Heterokaryon incompatibility n=1 Tax=Septoria linicola TaxID=215465 RepID=A0A9Q9AW42_9PEZI|nr:putative heterokaryon incompatibility [Septoria linicola]USW53037.1 Putative heterokaryon incompatibility [Septoria linicola]